MLVDIAEHVFKVIGQRSRSKWQLERMS